jgi:hypothetical protein
MNRILRSQSRQCMFPNASEWTNPFISKRSTQPSVAQKLNAASPTPLTIEDLRVILRARFPSPQMTSGWSFMQGWINLQFKYIASLKPLITPALPPIHSPRNRLDTRPPLGKSTVSATILSTSRRKDAAHGLV